MTLDIITHDSLTGIKHGFFGRRGGASSGVFSGLNCGISSTDQQDIVMINRARVAEAMGIDRAALAGVHQVHSAQVITLTEPTNQRSEADGIVTNVPGIALTILTADCQPVLFADRTAGVVGAAHAGWKGTLAGVLEQTIEQMEALGATRENTVAVIGPTISQRVYEVGQELFEIFFDEDPQHARFFVNGRTPDKFQFDLPGLGLHRLRQAGIEQAYWTRHCTYSEPDRFYSYRRATHMKEADYGRLISAIRL